MFQVTREGLSDIVDQTRPYQMRMDSQVCQCRTENIENEPGCRLAISELVAAVVGDDAHQVLTHCQLNGLLLAWVHLHAEGYEVEHCLVFQNRCCLEHCLVFKLCWILKHLKHDLPGLVLL